MPTACRVAGKSSKGGAAVRTAAALAAAVLAGCETAPSAPLREPVRPPAETKVNTPTPIGQPGKSLPAATAPAVPPVATVGDASVRREDLDRLLYNTYGLNMLMLLVQRDMCREACSQKNVAVTDADVKAEYDSTLVKMFPEVREGDDRERLLDQYLLQPRPRDQMGTRAEFDVIIETNTRLRKLVAPQLTRAVTDDMLQQQFDREYGAKALVRDIVVSNLQEAADITRRLAGGEDFAKLAQDRSRDPTKNAGGMIQPFTIKDTRLPENFKAVAFALKPGEISDPVPISNGYHIVKLERIEPPKAVKFADVKDSLKAAYEQELVKDAVNGLRARFAQQALTQLRINDAALRTEFENRVQARDRLIKDKDKIRQEMERQRAAASAPATAPAATSNATPAPPAASAATGPAAGGPTTRP